MASVAPLVDERARTATREAYRRARDLTGHLAELLADLAELPAQPAPSETIHLHDSARLAVGTIVRLLATGFAQAPAELDAWVQLLDELLTDAQAGYGGAEDQALDVAASSIAADVNGIAGVLPDGVFLRTARNDHVCRACRQLILRGERYAEDLNFVASYRAGDRYHLSTDCLGRQYPSWTPSRGARP